ncbi:hypothetical protein [Faecalimicrobium dakarense]|uniref:hypothetical protein n=1 Tax=Faecalimicrobium dakarense TaxID=1301100 RepID=UPI0004B8A7AE|nr:hypothetical protein [[Clostridium] dakarense]
MKNSQNTGKYFWTRFSSVRKTIALLLTVVFCYLSIIGKITQDQFIPVFSMVIGYYFGKSTALDNVSNSNKDNKNNNMQN